MLVIKMAKTVTNILSPTHSFLKVCHQHECNPSTLFFPTFRFSNITYYNLRIYVTWPSKCSKICTRICVARQSVLRVCLLRGVHTIGFCTQLNYASWPFLKEPKRVVRSLESVNKPPPPYQHHPKLMNLEILTDRNDLKTPKWSKHHQQRHLRIRLVPFQMTFQSKLRSKVTETDGDLVTDGLGTPSNGQTAKLLKMTRTLQPKMTKFRVKLNWWWILLTHSRCRSPTSTVTNTEFGSKKMAFQRKEIKKCWNRRSRNRNLILPVFG